MLGDGFEKHLSPEDFYIYMLAHEYKHYSVEGTGLRSILDVYVYLQKELLDMDYVATETETLGIAEFEAANRSLAQHLFSGGELTEADKEMLEYIMTSGAYGTLDHRVENRMKEYGGGKLWYMLNRFFVPVSKKNKRYREMAFFFPFFYKHRILLPLLPFYRVLRGLKNGKMIRELKILKQVKT